MWIICLQLLVLVPTFLYLQSLDLSPERSRFTLKSPFVLPELTPSTNVVHSKKHFHFVMHSHDDLGWLRTLEEYQSQAINPILSSTIDTLLKDPKATFTWCNIGFLYNYLQKFPQEIGKFQAAIKSGQLYVVNGGIAVHDNACVHLDDMLTNYEFGREFLQTKLGTNPNIGWLIDPFGHSKTTTRMYSKLGYQAYLINRISTYIRESMKERKQMLFNWVDPESDFKPMRMFTFKYRRVPFMV